MRTFGLIGYPLTHSFSEKYFIEKFSKSNIRDAEYKLFPLQHITKLHSLLQNYPVLCGLNVTVPYKQSVIPFLDELDDTAKTVGAVNCIKVRRKTKDKRQRLIGFNTDVYGFKESLKPILKNHHEKALILGTGGGAKAVAYVLKQIGIEYFFVSRIKTKNPESKTFVYEELNKNIIDHFNLIINTTPLGMYPGTNNSPAIPYEYINKAHLLYDLIYNPNETIFLKRGKEGGAQIQNGLTMLQLQAEESWKIWNNPS